MLWENIWEHTKLHWAPLRSKIFSFYDKVAGVWSLSNRYTTHRASDVCCFLLSEAKTSPHSWSKALDEFMVEMTEIKQHDKDFIVIIRRGVYIWQLCQWLQCRPWSMPALSSRGRCGTPGWCHLAVEACTARWNYWERKEQKRKEVGLELLKETD